MKIYTKGGDQGQTGLYGGRRVSKDDPRVDSYGGADELNALLGVARTAPLDPELDARLARIQDELFTLGSELAAPAAADNPRVPKVQSSWISELEHEIDAAETELPPLRHFILPGGTPGAAWLHFARTVCRRMERAVVRLSHAEPVSPIVLVYLNRLSDWLFVMARLANHRAQVTEPIWTAPK